LTQPTSVMSIRHANLWVQTHHHFDHSTRQNKTRFQRIFAHVNWVSRCCEICLSRHPLYHWPIDAAWKSVSEIFSIWGLCRCNQGLMRWGNGDSQLSNSLTKNDEPHQLLLFHARHGRWRIVYDQSLVQVQKGKV
jgi:hypothetical protein